MASATKLTNNSQETFAQNLFGSNTYFAIPIFQRPYKWNRSTLEDFQSDLLNIYSEEETHFLGAIILSDEITSPSEPRKFSVIDGQQRLTTIFLFMCAAVKLLAQNGKESEASNYILKFIVGGSPSGGSNILLQPSLRDRAQLNAIVSEIYKLRHLTKFLEPIPLKKLSAPTGSEDKGKLWDNYKSFERWLRNIKKSYGDDIQVVEKLLASALQFLSVVQIVVNDPTTGPTIYNSLNSKQEPMTIGELVKNGIFSKAADRPADEIEQLEEHSWRPFYDKFTVNGVSYFDRYFFPFGLTKNPNVKKQDTFSTLQKEWSSIVDPVAIIEDLQKHQDAFLDLVCGTKYIDVGPDLKMKVKNFHELHSPASLLPFVMQLLNKVLSKDVSELVACEILDLIESFLVRRAVCSIEPTGLHAVFKRLWSEIEASVSQAKVMSVMISHKTVQWPDDNEFEENIRRKKLYGAGICPYILRELDRSLGGDVPADKATIEHILPQTPEKSSQWCVDFSGDELKEMTDTIANLVLLSPAGQNLVKNKDYNVKQPVYIGTSMYKITRDFANTYAQWTPAEMEVRRNEIASWALSRWKHKPT